MRYIAVFLIGFVVGKLDISGLLKLTDNISQKAGTTLQEASK
jgi:hypothetical protein